MQQTSNATLPAQGQQQANGNVYSQLPPSFILPQQLDVQLPLRKPHLVAEYIRKRWDETFLYQQQIAVLMLNDYHHPIGILMVPLYIDEIVNKRGMVRSAVLSNCAQVFVAINTLDQGPNLNMRKREADLMRFVSEALETVDIGNRGYFFISPWADHYCDPLGGLEEQFYQKKK